MPSPFAQARKRLLEAELARRAPKASSSTFDHLADAFAAQRRFLEDRADQRAVCTTRRAGKTSAFVRDAVATSWANPNASVIYLNETRERAQQDRSGTSSRRTSPTWACPMSPSEAKLCLRGPANRWIFVSGGERKADDPTAGRGSCRKLVAAFIIDEAQDWRPELLL
jgi:hypothetical protein